MGDGSRAWMGDENWQLWRYPRKFYLNLMILNLTSLVQLTAIGMGMVMSTYQNDPHHLSGFVRRIMYQFIGPN